MLVDKAPEGFKKVATEGATCDGRIMKRGWIEQCDNNYNPKKFGARIWYEHFRWLGAYGDILETCRTENEEGKLCLHAKMDPLPELVKLNQTKQKIYPSIEVNPNFADTGEAYLVGLGVTDSPASLGTEMLKFSANATANPLESRKLSPDNIFSATSADLVLDFSEPMPLPATANNVFDPAQEKSFFSFLGNIFANFNQSQNPTEKVLDMTKPAQTDATQNHSATPETSAPQVTLEAFNALQTSHDELAEANKKLAEEFSSLKTELEKNQAPERDLATGGNGDEKFSTDC